MKTSRQTKILELIEQYDIETQIELTEYLNRFGFAATQATVSRDIKQLNLVKVQGKNGRSKYAATRIRVENAFSEKLLNIFRESIVSYDRAQNMVVIKTMPGLASAACSALDGMHLPDVVGTIAGDDTGFIVMRDNASSENFCQELKMMLNK